MPNNSMDIIQRLRQEPFNKETEVKLKSHPYLKAAEDGTLSLTQRQAFVQEQYFIQLSDAISFAFLAGHKEFLPFSLSAINVPEAVVDGNGEDGVASSVNKVQNLFQFLLGGEIYAAPLLLAYAKSVGLDNEAALKDSCQNTKISAKAQAYPSYWARLALSNRRAAGAAACAVNFPAWGDICRRLSEALVNAESYGYSSVDEEALAFLKFFATPIENLDSMAAAIIEEEGVPYKDLVEPVRLLQDYEVLFWDAIFEKK